MDHQPKKPNEKSDANNNDQINKIQRKIKNTFHNMEVSAEIMAETPDDSVLEELKEKNIKREHAIAGMKKDIRDIENLSSKK